MTENTNKTALITGTSGLAYEVALALAALSINVIIAGRNEEKGSETLRTIKIQIPHAQVSFELLDLTNLESISQCAQRIEKQHEKIDILINNAGVMAPPEKRTTADGFELQIGTNYLGHFALNQQILPLLLNSSSARVVSVTSLAYRIKPDKELLCTDAPYDGFKAYGESKLAQLMFALELQKRSEANHWNLISNAAHPGFAGTNIFSNQQGGLSRSVLNAASRYIVLPLLGQSAAGGALPIIYAATSDEAKGGELYGPGGLFEMSGPPKQCKIDAHASDENAASSLWTRTEELLGTAFTANL